MALLRCGQWALQALLRQEWQAHCRHGSIDSRWGNPRAVERSRCRFFQMAGDPGWLNPLALACKGSVEEGAFFMNTHLLLKLSRSLALALLVCMSFLIFGSAHS